MSAKNHAVTSIYIRHDILAALDKVAEDQDTTRNRLIKQGIKKILAENGVEIKEPAKAETEENENESKS